MYFAIIEQDENFAYKFVNKCKSILKDISHQFKIYSSLSSLMEDKEYLDKLDVLIACLNQNADSEIQSCIQIKQNYPRVGIIFYSDNIDLIPQAYDVDHLYFLLKKKWYDSLVKALNRAVQYHESFTRKNLAIMFKSKIDVIPIKEILYIQRSHRKINLITKNKVYETYMPVEEILKNVDINTFVQIHYSFIVNPDYIQSFKNNIVTMKNGCEIGITRNYIKQSRAYLKSRF